MGRDPEAGLMRIWHVNIGNHAGAVDGVAVTAARLSAALAGLGHDVSFLATPPASDVRRQIDQLGAEVDPVVDPSVTRVLSTAARRMWGRSTRPDVVHFHSVYRPAHFALFVLAKALGVVTVQSPHSGLAPARFEVDRVRKEIYGLVAERWLHRFADVVVALQRVESEDIARYCRRRRPIAVIPNAVEDSTLAQRRWDESATRAEPPVAVLLARFDVHQKGLDRLVELAERLPDMVFRVFGSQDKNRPELTDQLRAGAPPNFALCDPLHAGDKFEALRSARIFIMPSRVEGLSLALLEAMAVGLPCVVSSYVDRSIGMSESGIGVALSGDAGRDAELIRGLVRDRSRLVALSEAETDFVRRHCSAESVARQMVEVYASGLEARRRSRTGTDGT